ncbi:TadE/TadG family type IV pilus assembly protein [Mesorhizobium newzealandense]|uniref:TadE/TadG family type IV pilus assembly protein n=1 Tax=Mesorhizobium newzealandense TaxID=1300302 RepID=A0ABW4U800_9HYPH
MFKMLSRYLSRFRHDQRGAVIVEMTLITPLMLFLSAGVFEFGNLIHAKLLMEAGLTDGARYAARCNSKLYTDAGLTIDCAAVAKNIAVYGNPTGTTPARVAGWTTSDVTVTLNNSCQDAVSSTGVTEYRSTTAQVCAVRAAGTYAYTGVGMLSIIGIGPLTLHGSHDERLIRF